MSVRPIDVECPKCGSLDGAPCMGTTGRVRVSFHRERTTAAIRAAVASGAIKPRPIPKKRVVKRFGAFLRLYGPKDAPTHAVMILAHEASNDTPRGFLDELESEASIEREAKRIGIGTEFRMNFDGRPRITPINPNNAVRIYCTVWKPCVSLPPLKCAGFKQLRTYAQALAVKAATGGEVFRCDCCGHYHLVRKGFNHGAISRPIG